MEIHSFDPLHDRRWSDFAAAHTQASIFHQQAWLRALALTYGYRPLILTSAPAGQPLADGIAFCEVKSWITGNRLVSLPFADHCEPLTGAAWKTLLLNDWLRAQRQGRHWRYIEVRPLSRPREPDSLLSLSQCFWFHSLDLSPSVECLYGQLHKSCVQRRIRHAENQHLLYEKGRSTQLLEDFYRLLMMTRRRHHALPQPRAWFRNLAACLGDKMQVRVLRQAGNPIAAILTLRHGRTVTYKYGCSDERSHHAGGMPLLFWKLIEESKSEGAEQIDFGRTDADNPGLIEFKDRLGAARRQMVYLRYPSDETESSAHVARPSFGRALFSALPDTLSSAMGRIVYRHIG